MTFWPVRIAAIVGAVLLCFLLERVGRSLDSFTQQLIVFAGLYVTLAVSLNLINGITGQFSIGHAAFYQVGAYTSAYLGIQFYPSFHGNLFVWLTLMALCGAVTSAIAGFVVGLPSLRLKGDYLAIVTLGFGEIVRIVIQNQVVLGEAGGLTVNPHTTSQPIMFVALLAVLCVAVCRNLLKTAHGLPFLAVRVVVDTYRDELPRAVAAASEGGRLRVGRLLAGLARRPGDVGSLLRLAGRYRVAMRVLTRVGSAGTLSL